MLPIFLVVRVDRLINSEISYSTNATIDSDKCHQSRLHFKGTHQDILILASVLGIPICF